MTLNGDSRKTFRMEGPRFPPACSSQHSIQCIRLRAEWDSFGAGMRVCGANQAYSNDDNVLDIRRHVEDIKPSVKDEEYWDEDCKI